MTSQPEGVESGASPGARAATHVGAGIFLSRIFGLVRMRVEAYFYPGLHHEIFNELEKEKVLGHLVGWLDGRGFDS